MTADRAPGVLIREAVQADLDGLVASNIALFGADAAVHERMRNPGWAAGHMAELVARVLADPETLVLAAVHGETIVGHLTGVFLPASAMWRAPRAELFSMHVTAAWRGQGIGTRLTGRFADWAAGRGAAQLRVSAYAANTGAIRFYQRHGFAPLDITLARDV